MRLSRDERKVIVADLADQGVSSRAIAPSSARASRRWDPVNTETGEARAKPQPGPARRWTRHASRVLCVRPRSGVGSSQVLNRAACPSRRFPPPALRCGGLLLHQDNARNAPVQFQSIDSGQNRITQGVPRRSRHDFGDPS